MELDRAKIVDQNFSRHVLDCHFPTSKSTTTPEEAQLVSYQFLDLFHSQVVSRHLDIQARILRERNLGFYTIGSSGHEGNAAIGLVFRSSDMAFLHYRSGAFMVQRAKQQALDPIYDQLLSLVASSADPASGGRHKVFGSFALKIPPQTSTIASHLPKAVGAALSILLAKTTKLDQVDLALPIDSIILCSFGDGSLNHSTALGALNAASWAIDHQWKLPLLFICEDNEMSISVPTPKHWVAQNFQHKPHLHYLRCDGRNLADVYKAAKEAEHLIRKQKQTVFLHMKTTRLLGHAGSDIEFHYKTLPEIEAQEFDDPLLHSAKTILERKWLTQQQILAVYENVREEVAQKAKQALMQPKLQSTDAILSSLIPPPRVKPIQHVVEESSRKHVFGKAYDSLKTPKNMCQNINFALTDLMLKFPHIFVFGQDVGKKGGVYRVTQDLQQRFGQARVFDTLLDEQTILGSAIGMAHNHLLPIPEIQFLAYVHNAEDQIRGEAATLSFFSRGQFTNPMVIRIAGLAYQKGFGGHFHNDNAFGFLREIPGIIIACPSRAAQAAKLLRECVSLANFQQRVVIFLEPIALYMVKDLFSSGDNLALEMYPDPEEKIAFGEVSVEGNGKDLALISYGNGAYLARQAMAELKKLNIDVRLIDLQWLHPLPDSSLVNAMEGCHKVLIIDECRKTGSLSEGLISWMLETLHPVPAIQRITAQDCFIPIGQAWEHLLPSKQRIIDVAISFVEMKSLQTVMR